MIFSKFSKRFLTTILVLPISFFFIFYSQQLFLFFLFIIFIIASYEWFKLSSNNNFFFTFFLGFLFLIFSLCSTYYLRSLNDESIILWILLICIFSDIGGYFVGNLVGGIKLTKFSPNKTVSGSIGSFFFSLISLVVFLDNSTINLNFKIILITIFLCLICQLGDIFISFFKRKKNVKDTGELLPGHGGLLDRIDGMIFVMPVAALLKYFLIY